MNSLFRPTPRLLTLLAALVLLGPSARARGDDDDTGHSTARVQFSDPSKPGTLKLSLPWAEARITATDGKEVIVTSTLDQKGHKEVDSEGFRRIDEDVTFELVEKNNVAVVTVAGDNMWAAHGAEFEIKVPRSTNLILRTQAGGDIEVNGVQGDLDIHSMNGDVVLRDVGSSAVVETMNGEISASFKSSPTKAVSLSSMNGEIDLHLPSDTKANLRMRTHHGSIRTNFAEGVLQAKSEKSARDKSADAQPDLTIFIQTNGDITVGDDPAPVSLSGLEQIAAKTPKDDEVVVSIQTGNKANQKTAIAVTDVCRKAGLNKLRLESAGSADTQDVASSREISREMAREAARMDHREQAKIARDVAKAIAQANQITASVTTSVNGDTVIVNVPPVPPMPPMPPMPNFGGKSIVGTLNGGGVDIQLTSMNGTITLRETK